MAEYTTNYKLKKPSYDDFGDIADINGNMDIIDAELGKRANLDESGKLPIELLPSHKHSASDINAGTLDAARLPVVPVNKGGTGATTAEQARVNLGAASEDHSHTPEAIGAAPAYTYGTTDLTAGSSPLATGTLYFVYE